MQVLHTSMENSLPESPGWYFGFRDLTAFYLAGNAFSTKETKGEPHRARRG